LRSKVCWEPIPAGGRVRELKMEVRMKNKNKKRNTVVEEVYEDELLIDYQEEIIKSLRKINKILDQLNKLGRKYCVPGHYELLKEIHQELVKIANLIL
jgi:hypothetical protein